MSNTFKELLRSRSIVEYCTHLPSQKLPEGTYLVHNRVEPASPLGLNGFRAWIQSDNINLARCHCDFGGNANADINAHYRVIIASRAMH
jgi:hypothetical protein